MRRSKRLSRLGAITLALLVTRSVEAASNRVFISTTGNNANDCSNPLTPCVDFSGALSQVNAGGEVIAEATGPYGPLNITKAVTISGPPGVVIYSGHRVTVNAPGATVVLRGLTIDGNGAMEDAISVPAVSALYVESCVIANFTQSPGGQGNGIDFFSAGNLFVKDTIIRSTRVGIWVMPSSGTANASVENCRLERNDTGFITNPGGFASVFKSVAAGNVHAGFQNQGGELNLEKCVSTNNGEGIFSWSGTLRVSNTTITDNADGVDLLGGSILSRGNNTVEGNGVNGGFSGTFSAK
jgi:Right handed beta helix region